MQSRNHNMPHSKEMYGNPVIDDRLWSSFSICRNLVAIYLTGRCYDLEAAFIAFATVENRLLFSCCRMNIQLQFIASSEIWDVSFPSCHYPKVNLKYHSMIFFEEFFTFMRKCKTQFDLFLLE